MTDPDLGAACRRFFDAIVAHDRETILDCLADGAVISQNGAADSPLRNVAHPKVLQSMTDTLGPHRYEDVRQVVGVGAVAEQHRVRSVTPSGQVVDLDVCAVLRFDADGRITRFDEYVDPAKGPPT